MSSFESTVNVKFAFAFSGLKDTETDRKTQTQTFTIAAHNVVYLRKVSK